jgi:hypothetical protein
MHTGQIMESDTASHLIDLPKDKWRPIISPDIKLANIVLGAADEVCYPAYKTAKMIDFGQVFRDHCVVDGMVKHKYTCGTGSIGPPVSPMLRRIWPVC